MNEVVAFCRVYKNKKGSTIFNGSPIIMHNADVQSCRPKNGKTRPILADMVRTLHKAEQAEFCARCWSIGYMTGVLAKGAEATPYNPELSKSIIKNMPNGDREKLTAWFT